MPARRRAAEMEVGDVDAFLTQDRADLADDARPVMVPDEEHDRPERRLEMDVLHAHQPQPVSKQCAGDGAASFTHGGPDLDEGPVAVRLARRGLAQVDASFAGDERRVHHVDGVELAGQHALQHQAG